MNPRSRFSSDIKSDGSFILDFSASEVKVTQLCLTLRPHGLYSPWNSLGQNTEVGSLSLLQEIFPTQGSNPGLPHWRWILYQLSQKGSPNSRYILLYEGYIRRGKIRSVRTKGEDLAEFVARMEEI